MESANTDRGYMDSNNCLSRTEIALSVSCKHLSRIVVGPHIVGLTPLDNSIQIGNTDRGYMDSNNCLSRTEIALSVSCKHLSRIVVGPHIVGLTPLDNSI